MYQQYKRPPNIHLAKQHAIAKRFAAPTQFAEFEKLELCPCCGYPYKNVLLNLCVPISEFSFIGSGVVLYFDFHRYSQILLLIYISIVGIYTLYDNSQGTRCQIENCSKDIYNSYSRVMVYKPLDVVASYLNFCTLLVLMISTLFYRRHINRICLEIDDAEIEVSDYSVMLQGLPHNCKQVDIEGFFYKEDVELRKVCMAYEIKHYLKLLTDLEEKNIELSKVLHEENKKLIIDIESDILEIQKKLQYVQLYKDNIFYFTGIAFLSFNREKHADYVCEQFNMTKFQLLLYQLNLFKYNGRRFQKSPIVAKKAPLPGDILWENLGIDIKEHYKRIVITNAVTMFLLSVGLSLIFGLSYLQEWINAQVNYDPTTTIIIVNFLGFLASLIVSLINSALSSNIMRLINKEQHPTKTELDISIAKKTGLAEFINGAILTLLVNLLIKGQNETRLQTIYQSGGLNSDVLWIFVTDNYLPWFMLILDFEHIKKLYFRRKIKTEGSHCTLTQKEANEIFEGPMINLAEKYPSVTKTLLMALFYSPLLPACSFLALLSLSGIYWIEKILLVRRDSRPLPTGSEMALAMVEYYVDLILLVYSIGNIMWEYIVFNEIHIITLVSLIICGVFYFLPKERVFGWIVNIHLDNATEESYDEKTSTFLDDYDRRNPITADEAKLKWQENNEQDPNFSYLQTQMRQHYKSFSKVHPEFKVTYNYHFVIK